MSRISGKRSEGASCLCAVKLLLSGHQLWSVKARALLGHGSEEFLCKYFQPRRTFLKACCSTLQSQANESALWMCLLKINLINSSSLDASS